MAVAYDADNNGSEVFSGNSDSDTITIGTGSNRNVIVHIGIDAEGATFGTFDFDTIQMTLLSGSDSTTTVGRRTLVYFHNAEPGDGSKTVDLDWGTSSEVRWGIISFEDSDQTTRVNNGTFVTDVSEPTTKDIPITSNSGDLTFSNIYRNSGVDAPTSGETQQWLSGATAAGDTGPGTANPPNDELLTEWRLFATWEDGEEPKQPVFRLTQGLRLNDLKVPKLGSCRNRVWPSDCMRLNIGSLFILYDDRLARRQLLTRSVTAKPNPFWVTTTPPI